MSNIYLQLLFWKRSVLLSVLKTFDNLWIYGHKHFEHDYHTQTPNSAKENTSIWFGVSSTHFILRVCFWVHIFEGWISLAAVIIARTESKTEYCQIFLSKAWTQNLYLNQIVVVGYHFVYFTNIWGWEQFSKIHYILRLIIIKRRYFEPNTRLSYK